ncbi:MAG: glycosyltransferase [Bdellovibrionaceae bacterium]|nr:glycosyltransferase [Pseudobdellovibrionaceae bacterium]
MTILPYKAFANKNLFNLREISEKSQASVVIAFYNNWQFLELVLASLETQTFKDFEVIIADDGSRQEVVETIHRFMKTTNLSIMHLWQPDNGWRKVELLNKSLAMASSDYIITLDQDCIVHKEFIKEHILNREEKTILSGRRAEFTPFINRRLTPKKIKNDYIQKNYWWMWFFMFYIKDNQWLKGIYLNDSWLRRRINRRPRRLVGCNMSYFKHDLIAINGYDMSFAAPCGAEDADIEKRALNAGYKIKSVIHAAVQYHLFHPLRPSNQNDIDAFQENRKQDTKISSGYNLIHTVDLQLIPD